MDDLAKKIEIEYLGLDSSEARKIVNPFENRSIKDIEEPHLHLLRLMRDPNYFYFTCRALMNGPDGRPLELLPFQCVILRELWYRPFPMLVASRGAGKSWLLALYAMLRALFIQGRKIVITGSGFRQAKTVFQYAETIWNNSPMLQSLVAENPESGPHHGADRWVLRLGDSTITALPLGDGQKIRGERANDVISDEHASVPPETFETVVAGFGVVEIAPVVNVKEHARIRVLKRHRLWTPEMEQEHRLRVGNQTIIAGTASYQFNHFYTYWRRWKGYIESKGDPRKLLEIFRRDGKDEIPPNFDWRDYSIIRLPVELLPEGFMDAKQIARSKATQHTGTFQNEFSAVYSGDSNGFYKRSLVESCVTSKPIIVNGEPVQFRATTKGDEKSHYIYGIDPASEHDRFSIVILEVYPSHRRIVYCWTTTRQEFRARVDKNLTTEGDFYGFCARKIRDLMRAFPCEHIAMDSQGGGVAVAEALADPDKLHRGEQPLWQIAADHPLSDGKERESDTYAGLHIIELVNFARAEWTSEANHGMRKDFEDKVLLFPEYDPGVLAIAMEDDSRVNRIYDTLEDAVTEVEEIKEELATIIHTQTPGSFRDHWDTPEVKTEGSKKGRLRKDRYSALLMANAAARRLNRMREQAEVAPWGGFVNNRYSVAPPAPASKRMYASAPDWFASGVEGNREGYGWVVRRDGVEY